MIINVMGWMSGVYICESVNRQCRADRQLLGVEAPLMANLPTTPTP